MWFRLRNTDQVQEMNGFPVRAWVGVAEDGTEVTVFVAGMALREDMPVRAKEEFARRVRGSRARAVPLIAPKPLNGGIGAVIKF